MCYSDEQLFYQVIVHPFEEHSQFVVYQNGLLMLKNLYGDD